MTVTKVVEGCVYIRRRYYGILRRVGGEFEHSALSPLSLRSFSLALSSNSTTLNHLNRLRGSQGIQIWKQRTRNDGDFRVERDTFLSEYLWHNDGSAIRLITPAGSNMLCTVSTVEERQACPVTEFGFCIGVVLA